MNSPLLFLEAHPTREQIVAEARLYLDLPFEMKHPKIEWRDGNPIGKTHCVHLLFTIAQRLGYLPPEWSYKAFASQARFSPDLSAPDGSLDAALRAVLEANCDRVEGFDLFGGMNIMGLGAIRVQPIVLPGDIILSQMDRVSAKGAHHVAIAMPNNKVLHAIDYPARPNASKVQLADWWSVQDSVVEIWRLRGIRDGE
jgi:cell wall-associated NlpC family hydrolase